MKGDEDFITVRKLQGNDRGESFSKNGYKNKHVSTTDESTPLRRLASEVIFKAIKDYKKSRLFPESKRAQRDAVGALEFLKNTDSPWHRILDLKSGIFHDMADKIERDIEKELKSLEDNDEQRQCI